MKKRDTYLDSVGGLLLSFMIVMHCAQWSSVWPLISKYTYFLNFFMPWFFFKGGMFYRQNTLKETIYKGYKRLVIPFLFFSIIGTMLLWAIYAVNHTLSTISIIKSIGGIVLYGSFPGNLALWFLLSLFIVRVIFNLLYNIINDSSLKFGKLYGGVMLIVLCVLFIPLYYIRIKYKIFIPYYFLNVSCGLAFYTCGYLLKDFNPKLWILIIIGVAYILEIIFIPIRINMFSVDSSNVVLLIPFSLLGILTFNLTSRKYLNNENIFSKIGKDTMPFYCIHWCIIEIVALFFCNSYGPNVTYFITLISANVILLPLISKIIYNTRLKKIFLA